MTDFTWVLKLLPESASVTAVIVVVVLFLRYTKEMHDNHSQVITALTNNFLIQLADVRSAFNDELKQISEIFHTDTEIVNTRVNVLTEKSLQVAIDTINAMNLLRESVEHLGIRVKIDDPKQS